MQSSKEDFGANYIQLEPEGGLDGFHGNEKQMAGKKKKSDLVCVFKMSSFEQAGCLGVSQLDTPWDVFSKKLHSSAKLHGKVHGMLTIIKP